jgi:WS/DGAT/MGAT family acyltransferase
MTEKRAGNISKTTSEGASAKPSQKSRAKKVKGIEFDAWMSDNDALMWRIERDPLLRSTILCVWTLDRAPDRVRLHATLEKTERLVPRLRQRVVSDPLGVSPPRWEPDPYFDVNYHVRTVRVPGAGTMRDLLDMAAPVAMQAFDKDRPLWELYCVEGLEGGRAGILLKLHHAMSDGVGLVRMTEGLVERSRAAAPRPVGGEYLQEQPEAAQHGELFHLGEAVLHRASTAIKRGRRAAAAVRRGLTSFAGHPLTAAGEVVETLESVGRLLRPVSEPMSPLWRNRSLGLHLDVLEVPLDDMLDTAHSVGCTLNDVFVAAVAGGLARHHEDADRPTKALRMTMPINLRTGEKGLQAGNQFVPARFAIPLDIDDPRERMLAIHKLILRQRDEPALGWMDEITAAINVLGEAGATRLTGTMMKALDLATSNVPGPPFSVYMSGARIEHMFPFGPPAGAAVNITLFSYDGVAHIGVNADRAAIGDCARLRYHLEQGFAETLSVA